MHITPPCREGIWKLFNAISPTYDRANRVLSLGLDQVWRKRMKRYLPAGRSLSILDCATGTGEQIKALMEEEDSIRSVVGIDLAEEMLQIARQKIAQTPYRGKIHFQQANALELPFADNHFDCITIAFGIRNVTHVMAALQEFRRVLKPGGRVLILEGTVPKNKILKALHLFYLRHYLPYVGGWISRNRSAYRYLNETIETFPQAEKFTSKMRAAGLVKVHANPLWGGIATIYQGDKDALL